jgi:hypothetical protein
MFGVFALWTGNNICSYVYICSKFIWPLVQAFSLFSPFLYMINLFFLHNIITYTVLICVLNSRLVDALMGPLVRVAICVFLCVHYAWTLKAVLLFSLFNLSYICMFHALFFFFVCNEFSSCCPSICSFSFWLSFKLFVSICLHLRSAWHPA